MTPIFKECPFFIWIWFVCIPSTTSTNCSYRPGHSKLQWGNSTDVYLGVTSRECQDDSSNRPLDCLFFLKNMLTTNTYFKYVLLLLCAGNLRINSTLWNDKRLQLSYIWCLRPWVQILHSAEEDSFSPFDLNIACLCQSIEINNNKHVLTGLYSTFRDRHFVVNILFVSHFFRYLHGLSTNSHCRNKYVLWHHFNL